MALLQETIDQVSKDELKDWLKAAEDNLVKAEDQEENLQAEQLRKDILLLEENIGSFGKEKEIDPYSEEGLIRQGIDAANQVGDLLDPLKEVISQSQTDIGISGLSPERLKELNVMAADLQALSSQVETQRLEINKQIDFSSGELGDLLVNELRTLISGEGQVNPIEEKRRQEERSQLFEAGSRRGLFKGDQAISTAGEQQLSDLEERHNRERFFEKDLQRRTAFGEFATIAGLRGGSGQPDIFGRNIGLIGAGVDLEGRLIPAAGQVQQGFLSSLQPFQFETGIEAQKEGLELQLAAQRKASKSSGIGSILGGIGGSFFGPIGTSIGSKIGGLITEK